MWEAAARDGWGPSTQGEADGDKWAVVLHTCPAINSKRRGVLGTVKYNGQSLGCGHSTPGKPQVQLP